MTLDVLNIKGEATGRSVTLPEEVFGITPNEHVIYLAVKNYLAAQRLGTHKTKTRAEVKGSSKKLHKQKGTGGSRKGNIRNPLYKGGGTVNGPSPHKYTFKLNRKVKDLAKISALAYKAQSGNIVVVEDLNLETPKTKEFNATINALRGQRRKSLVVLGEQNKNVVLSGRNLPNVKTRQLLDLNTFDIVNSNVLIFTESAISLFNESPDEAVETQTAIHQDNTAPEATHESAATEPTTPPATTSENSENA